MSSYVHPRKAFGNEDVIYKARQYENALQERVQFVQQYERLMRYAQFEQLNGPRSSHRGLAEKLAAMREEREQALLHRRHKLSMLLATEDRILQNEIQTGNMNLSERRAWLLSRALALSCSSQRTNLEKALHEDYNEVSMHNSVLAIRRTEAERKRHRDNIATCHQSLFEHGLIGAPDDNEEAIDILRRHLFMVEQLREAERAAVEEDMVRMHRTWLEEEETLKLKQLEQRHRDSLHVEDLLLHKTNDKRSAREAGGQEHPGMVAMAVDKETEEEKQLEELRAGHRREAVAYVWQLKAAAEKQRIEDEELQATVKSTMAHGQGPDIMHYKDPQPNSCDLGTSEGMSMASTDCTDAQNLVKSDAVYDTEHMASALSKKELADVLEGQVRGSRAAGLVDGQEMNRLAEQAGGGTDYILKKLANAESGMKQSSSSMGLPYPEPYYGRKNVNWYE